MVIEPAVEAAVHVCSIVISLWPAYAVSAREAGFLVNEGTCWLPAQSGLPLTRRFNSDRHWRVRPWHGSKLIKGGVGRVMNWSRALFRIWVAVAVAVSVSWVVYLGVYLYLGHLKNPTWPSAPHGLPDWTMPIIVFLTMAMVPAGLFIVSLVGWVCLRIGRRFCGR